ncbi:MAG: hypothetical protein ACO3VG_00320, partial [Nitriliruptoraceae bacterium]
RLAESLPEGTLSVLVLRVGGTAAEARLTVRARAARRAVATLALDGPALGAPWTRRRGDAAIELRCTPRADAGVEGVVGPAARLLSALGWPVADWVPEA